MRATHVFTCALLITAFVAHPSNAQEKKDEITIEKVRQALDKTITVDFAHQSLNEVLNHLQGRIGVPIIPDQTVTPDIDNVAIAGGLPSKPIKVKATNEKASEVLRKLLNSQCLSYVILEEGVFVTTDETATARQFLQRINLAVDNVPLKTAARQLARKYGVNFTIDPKTLKQAETAVSIELDNVSLETAMRMLAELANLKVARLGNVMLITSEERAKKIREEEAQAFDNPLGQAVGGTGGRSSMASSGTNRIQFNVPQVVVPGAQAVPAFPGAQVVPAPPPAPFPAPKN